MYFSPYIATDGVHMPTYEDRLEGLISSYKSIFGSDVNLEISSPDYQLLSVFARAMDDLSQMIAYDFVSRNPQYASGTALDLIMPLFGLSRSGATYSTVYLTLKGTPGAILPSAPVALDDAGYLWKCQVSGITLDANGQAKAQAVCTTAGAISAAIGTVRRLVSPVAGLSSVVNEVAAVAGNEAETDASCRNRLRMAAASPAVSTLEALQSAVALVPNVKACRVYENNTDTTDSNGLPAHSIAVTVQGGLTTDIVPVIFNKKAPGIGTYGATSGTVTDAFGAQHTIKFQRATPTPVSILIELKPMAGYDATVKDRIRAAIVEYGNGIGIGQELVVSSLFGLCYGADQGGSPTFALSLLTATASGVTTTTVLTPAWNQRFTFAESMITINEV